MEEAEKGEVLERNTKPGLDSHPGPTAGLFTDDLILEVLARLPARSLHRFKCVSVLWRDLIADPANRKKLPQALAGFLYTTTDDSGQRHHFASVSGAAAPFDPCLQPNKDMAKVDSCNGLLLYRRYYEKLCTLPQWDWEEDNFRFVVCNPLTGRWVELPPQPPVQVGPANRYSLTVGLAFDPVVSSHFHVLHFEQNYLGSCMTGVCIYSSRTGVWSRRGSGMTEKVELFFSNKCVFAGGMMYVIGNLKNINKDDEYVLVGVDMEGKVWNTIRVPYSSRVGTIGSSQGCLHYAIPPVDNNGIIVSEIELWCLNDHDSKELVLKHTTSIVKLVSMTGKKYRVVEIHPDCDTVFLVSSGGDTLVAYDMRHQKVGRIIHLEENITQRQRFLPYVPLFSELLADAHGQFFYLQTTRVLPSKIGSSVG